MMHQDDGTNPSNGKPGMTPLGDATSYQNKGQPGMTPLRDQLPTPSTQGNTHTQAHHNWQANMTSQYGQGWHHHSATRSFLTNPAYGNVYPQAPHMLHSTPMQGGAYQGMWSRTPLVAYHNPTHA